MATIEEHAARIRERLGRALRIGGIDYLNSRPLIEAFRDRTASGLDLVNLPPSELARRLRARELDVALVPVAEYFTAPPGTDYRILPGMGISSFGPVESIRLFHRAPLGEIEQAALDRSSMTSVLLARLLFEEQPDGRWSRRRGAPQVSFSMVGPAEGAALVEDRTPGSAGAVLLIGDAAMQAAPAAGWSFLDLGGEWTRWTGLPFVYAFWVLNGPPIPGLAQCFQDAARDGFAQIDAIVNRGPLPPGKSPAECLRYLSRVIRFRLGPPEMEGMLEFIRRVDGRRLAPVNHPIELRFLED